MHANGTRRKHARLAETCLFSSLQNTNTPDKSTNARLPCRRICMQGSEKRSACCAPLSQQAGGIQAVGGHNRTQCSRPRPILWPGSASSGEFGPSQVVGRRGMPGSPATDHNHHLVSSTPPYQPSDNASLFVGLPMANKIPCNSVLIPFPSRLARGDSSSKAALFCLSALLWPSVPLEHHHHPETIHSQPQHPK